ncbi:hypothetical protein, partial [Paraburkholderia nemoris]|uniref:hypothetical protein n=1 Tax=Paraburkholderia nemoris TaxID=2793076 RepID=UPI001B8C760C
VADGASSQLGLEGLNNSGHDVGRPKVAESRPKPNLPDHDQIVTTTESIHTPDVPGVNTLLIAAASDDMLVGSIAAEQARISEPTTPVLLRSSGI